MDVSFYSINKSIVVIYVRLENIRCAQALDLIDIQSSQVNGGIIGETIKKMIKEVLNEQQRKERETATQQNELL